MHPRCALGISARAGADQHWSGRRRVQRLLSEMFAVDVPREWERSNFQGKKHPKKTSLAFNKNISTYNIILLNKKSALTLQLSTLTYSIIAMETLNTTHTLFTSGNR